MQGPLELLERVAHLDPAHLSPPEDQGTGDQQDPRRVEEVGQGQVDLAEARDGRQGKLLVAEVRALVQGAPVARCDLHVEAVVREGPDQGLARAQVEPRGPALGALRVQVAQVVLDLLQADLGVGSRHAVERLRDAPHDRADPHQADDREQEREEQGQPQADGQVASPGLIK
ncbi:hypothetical protein D3C86_1251780 [compost metagenome]